MTDLSPDEVPMPDVSARCDRCRVLSRDVEEGRVIVSPAGLAHYGADNGVTDCGIDATGDLWWWPL